MVHYRTPSHIRKKKIQQKKKKNKKLSEIVITTGDDATTAHIYANRGRDAIIIIQS